MMGQIHIDLTEILQNPVRTGIQRVVRQAIRNWPVHIPLAPCCIDRDGVVRRIADSVLTSLCQPEDGTEKGRSLERHWLSSLATKAVPITDRSVDKLLCLELYYDQVRAAAHLRLAGSGCKVLCFLYDFLPYLHPGLFASAQTRHLMYFLRALGGIGPFAFLSQQTKREFIQRIARNNEAAEAPVFPPGADGLGLERQVYSSDRQSFVSIGTVEKRKNVVALLEGFETLWSRGVPAKLVIAGTIAADATAEQEFFAKHANTRWLQVLDRPTDLVLQEVLRKAVAIVMPSETEGFGLPPYEGVFSGIPAIASRNLPCAEFIENGALLLDRVTPGTIAATVTKFMDIAFVEGLWQEVAGVRLPSWAAFGAAIGQWAQST